MAHVFVAGDGAASNGDNSKMKSETTPRAKKSAQNTRKGPKAATKKKTTKKDSQAKTSPTGEPGPTLGELADAYLNHLEKVGKSPATVFSYRMDLVIARTNLGDETPAGSLTQEQVAEFFASDAVTKKKSGANKTDVTIKKTQRVLRQALVWAAEQKLIDSAPLP